MMNVLMLLICVLAFGALAMATDRAQTDVLGRELAAKTSRLLRCVGWVLLVVALALAVQAQGWGLGLVRYSGLTSLAAGLVFVVLIGWVRRRGR